MYKVTRKNGSFPGGMRSVWFVTYNAARTYLRTYLRSLFGSVERSKHPPLSLAKEFGVFISKV